VTRERIVHVMRLTSLDDVGDLLRDWLGEAYDFAAS
jgi:hypothetical protein